MKKGSLLVIASAMMICSGVFGIITVIFGIVTVIESEPTFPCTYLDSLINDFKGFVVSQSIIIGCLSVFPVIGGVFALKKKYWLITLVFSLSLLPIAFPYGMIIGLFVFILLILSKKEFRDNNLDQSMSHE